MKCVLSSQGWSFFAFSYHFFAGDDCCPQLSVFSYRFLHCHTIVHSRHALPFRYVGAERHDSWKEIPDFFLHTFRLGTCRPSVLQWAQNFHHCVMWKWPLLLSCIHLRRESPWLFRMKTICACKTVFRRPSFTNETTILQVFSYPVWQEADHSVSIIYIPRTVFFKHFTDTT